jgi:hypothetical protein
MGLGVRAAGDASFACSCCRTPFALCELFPCALPDIFSACSKVVTLYHVYAHCGQLLPLEAPTLQRTSWGCTCSCHAISYSSAGFIFRSAHAPGAPLAANKLLRLSPLLLSFFCCSV